MIWADRFTGTEVEFIVCDIQYDLKLDILFIHDAYDEILLISAANPQNSAKQV